MAVLQLKSQLRALVKDIAALLSPRQTSTSSSTADPDVDWFLHGPSLGPTSPSPMTRPPSFPSARPLSAPAPNPSPFPSAPTPFQVSSPQLPQANSVTIRVSGFDSSIPAATYNKALGDFLHMELSMTPAQISRGFYHIEVPPDTARRLFNGLQVVDLKHQEGWDVRLRTHDARGNPFTPFRPRQGRQQPDAKRSRFDSPAAPQTPQAHFAPQPFPFGPQVGQQFHQFSLPPSAPASPSLNLPPNVAPHTATLPSPSAHPPCLSAASAIQSPQAPHIDSWHSPASVDPGTQTAPPVSSPSQPLLANPDQTITATDAHPSGPRNQWYWEPILPNGFRTVSVIDDILWDLSKQYPYPLLPRLFDDFLSLPVSFMHSFQGSLPPIPASLGCWECGAAFRANHIGSAQCLVCPACGKSSTLSLPLPAASFPPVLPLRRNCPSLPRAEGMVSPVVKVLESHFEGLVPAIKALLFLHIRRWFNCVRRNLFTPQSHQCNFAFSPPILHGRRLMVLRSSSISGARGFQFRRREPQVPSLWLIASALCRDCGNTPISTSSAVANPTWVFSHSSLCRCAPAQVHLLSRGLAQYSSVSIGEFELGEVIPIDSIYRPKFHQPPAHSPPCDPAWSQLWSPPKDFKDRLFRSQGNITMLSHNCGGPQANLHELASLLLSTTPGVVFLQEMWDSVLTNEVNLRCYHHLFGAVKGPGKGLQILIHRSICLEARHISVLYDTRSLFVATLITTLSSRIHLACVHLDPHMSVEEKEGELSVMASIMSHIKSQFQVVAGDFKVNRTPRSLLHRLVKPGECLSFLHVPYPPGRPTNSTFVRGVKRETEIDYILCSAKVHANRVESLPGISSHSVLLADFPISLGRCANASRRFNHKVAMPSQNQDVGSLVSLYWWWLSSQNAPPDAWVYCYWSLADRILPPTPSVALERHLKLGKSIALTSPSPSDIESWWSALRSKLLLQGLRLSKDVVMDTDVTRCTTKLVLPKSGRPCPFPPLLPRPDYAHTDETSSLRFSASEHAHTDETSSLRFSASELWWHHSSRGTCMNLPRLLCCSEEAPALPYDDPSFSHLSFLRREGLWSGDFSTLLCKMKSLPAHPVIDVLSVKRCLAHKLSNATSLDDLPYAVLRELSGCGISALVSYMEVLRRTPEALSNAVIQLGIFKKGPKHLFSSYRPIKLGSAVNRLEGFIVHEVTSIRAELSGCYSGPLFAYRSELSPSFLALSLRAAVTMTLLSDGQVHLVDGDESGAFDMPIREDVSHLTKIWSMSNDFGSFAGNLYNQQRFHLWSSLGLCPAVQMQEGFPQGCSLAATAFGVLGCLRTSALRNEHPHGHAIASLPVFEFVYSDDRRWLGRTAREVEQTVSKALCLAQDACASNNVAKMKYSMITLGPTGKPSLSSVGSIDIMNDSLVSENKVPIVVGLPAIPNFTYPGLQASFFKRCSRLRHFFHRHRPPYLLISRCVTAYLLSFFDFHSRGAAIPMRSIPPLSTALLGLFRSFLNARPGTPNDVLMTPVGFLGWGCPDLRIRTAVNFVMGFLKAWDCRSVFTRTLLREQSHHCLPCGGDDYSRFRDFLSFLGVDLESPGQVGESLPVIPNWILSAREVFVTTDASLTQRMSGGTRRLVGNQVAGLGIVCSSSDGASFSLAWKLEVAGCSSTHMEWLAKLSALCLLRGFEGTIHFFCDNASSHLCNFSRVVRVPGWIDRFSRFVLSLPILDSVREYWLPAQHDSRSGKRAAAWQAEADHLARQGALDPVTPVYPLWSFMSMLPDPPLVPSFHGAIVVSHSLFFNELSQAISSRASRLWSTLGTVPFSKPVWARVLTRTDLSTHCHRVAFGLRSSCSPAFTSCIFRDCEFCGFPLGDCFHHFVSCPAIYARMCEAFRKVLFLLFDDLGLVTVDVRDLTARVALGSGSLIVAMADEPRAMSMYHAHSKADVSFLLLTWSGLILVHPPFAFGLSTEVCVKLSTTVLLMMGCPQTYERPPSPPLIVSDPNFPRPSPFPMIPMDYQLTIAWL